MFAKENLKYISPMGDEMYVENDSLIVRLMGHRGIVSSSNLNGGYREDVKYIYNHSCAKNPFVLAKKETEIQESTLDEYFEELALHIGLPVDSTTGMDTAAKIENLAISTRQVHGVEVMAVATAGIDVNGGRAGDKATYDEFAKEGLPIKSGTINILLFIDANLNAGVLTRAIVTATEAKSAALQELMANSMFSEGIATGSGTDSIVIVANKDSNTPLYSSGKHVLLGQMIGESVKEAVSKALDKQTGMNPRRQASIEWQSKRYGITKDNILNHFCDISKQQYDIERIRRRIDEIDTDGYILASVAAITHLCDQNRWNILSDDVLITLANELINGLIKKHHIDYIVSIDKEAMPKRKGYKLVIEHTMIALAIIASNLQ